MLLGAVGARAAHRLRQRRQPDARARHRAEPRDGHPGGARRQPWRWSAGCWSKASCCRSPARRSACCSPMAASRSSGVAAGELPRVADIGIDLRVLAATIATAVLTGIIFGIVPAFQSSRPDLTTRSRTAAVVHRRPRHQWLRNALVVCRGRARGRPARRRRPLRRQLRPADAHRPRLRLSQRARPERRRARAAGPVRRGHQARQRLRRSRCSRPCAACRASTACAVVSGGLPLTGSWSRTGIELARPAEARRRRRLDRSPARDARTICSCCGFRSCAAATCPTTDRGGAEMVIVINEAAARKYWPGEDPIGQRVKMNSTERVVVGIVGDIRHLGPETPARQECYIPFPRKRTSAARWSCARPAIRWRCCRRSRRRSGRSTRNSGCRATPSRSRATWIA